jgi:hypothetical protein
MMGRTSFEQSIQFFRSFGPDQLEKTLSKDMKECKNLLVYHRPEDHLFPEEMEILKRTIPYAEGPGYQLRILPLDSLFKTDPNFTLKHFKSNADTLIEIKKGLWVDQIPGNDFWYISNFDEEKYPGHTSQNRYRGTPNEYSIILKLAPGSLRKTVYEVGFDYYSISNKTALNNSFFIQHSHPDGGSIKWIYDRWMVNFPIQFNDHMSFKAVFIPEDTTLVHEFFLKGPDSKEIFELDHFYVRPLDIQILREENGSFYLNNLPIH